jgi:hypothetical protein
VTPTQKDKVLEYYDLTITKAGTWRRLSFKPEELELSEAVGNLFAEHGYDVLHTESWKWAYQC